jgi:hypothetical protein
LHCPDLLLKAVFWRLQESLNVYGDNLETVILRDEATELARVFEEVEESSRQNTFLDALRNGVFDEMGGSVGVDESKVCQYARKLLALPSMPAIGKGDSPEMQAARFLVSPLYDEENASVRSFVVDILSQLVQRSSVRLKRRLMFYWLKAMRNAIVHSHPEKSDIVEKRVSNVLHALFVFPAKTSAVGRRLIAFLLYQYDSLREYLRHLF